MFIAHQRFIFHTKKRKGKLQIHAILLEKLQIYIHISDLCHDLQIYVNTQIEFQNDGPPMRIIQNYRSMYLITDLCL